MFKNRNYDLNNKIIVQSLKYQPAQQSVTRVSLGSGSGSNLTFVVAASKWNCKISIFNW